MSCRYHSASLICIKFSRANQKDTMQMELPADDSEDEVSYRDEEDEESISESGLCRNSEYVEPELWKTLGFLLHKVR